MTTHAEHSANVKNATPCSAHHMTFGARCLNCGWVDLGIYGDSEREIKEGEALDAFQQIDEVARMLGYETVGEWSES